ncbi:UNVERIFIED_CONTAM: RNA-directed DNA polymerase [Sesamum indicum]
MCGSMSSGTLRVKCSVNGKEIHILIDSGNTYTFVDENVIRALGIKTECTTSMMMSIADGYKLLSRIIYPELSWEIQSHQFSYPVRALKLGGCDFVLSCDWLGAHNLVELDFHQLIVTISQKGKKLFSANTMKGKGLQNPTIFGLLQQFENVSQEPHSLPPIRSIEHKIELIPNAIPRKQHLYRHLNKLTIKHNFLIPVLDELLDELHGARYFSKIDLRSGYFQIKMREEDVSKTSFITHSGYYEFLVMHFGLCNASSICQALMN